MISYFNICKSTCTGSADTLFPLWSEKHEKLVVLSPHDDDALLGAGYIINDFVQKGIPVELIIFCNGDAGYSVVCDKDNIVAKRKEETFSAYAMLGVAKENIHYFDNADFSVCRAVGRSRNNSDNGSFEKLVKLLRKLQPTRLFIPNGYKEHSDHTAVFTMGTYDAVQSGDPVLVDWGKLTEIKSTHIYSVWADFSPEDALINGRDVRLRASCGICVDNDTELKMMRALSEYSSQREIIDDMVLRRQERKCMKGFIEVYQWIDPRPKLSYNPYTQWFDTLN